MKSTAIQTIQIDQQKLNAAVQYALNPKSDPWSRKVLQAANWLAQQTEVTLVNGWLQVPSSATGRFNLATERTLHRWDGKVLTNLTWHRVAAYLVKRMQTA
jgi:hypothetical protein